MQKIKEIVFKISNVKSQLEKQTKERFESAFEAKNVKQLNECIIVFFNMEILRDMVQLKVNQSLK